MLTDNPAKVERLTKDRLRNRNDLVSAVHKNKKKRDTELLVADTREYKAFVEMIQEIAAECQVNEVNMDFEKELTKRLEIESRKAEAEARTAEANASVRLLELQIELKRLELAHV